MKGEGFKDIETFTSHPSEPNLKEWDSCYFHLRNTPDYFKIKQDYFYLGEHFLESAAEILSELEQEIWKLHLQGLGVRQIATLIKGKKALHSPHCKPENCDLFCEVITSPVAPIMNKDKVAALILKLKQQMRIFMRENIAQVNVELDEEGFAPQTGGLVWIN